jgi:hypothetical protein
MLAFHEAAYEIAHDHMDISWYQAGTVFAREGLELSDECLRFVVHKEQLPRTGKEDDSGGSLYGIGATKLFSARRRRGVAL